MYSFVSGFCSVFVREIHAGFSSNHQSIHFHSCIIDFMYLLLMDIFSFSIFRLLQIMLLLAFWKRFLDTHTNATQLVINLSVELLS